MIITSNYSRSQGTLSEPEFRFGKDMPVYRIQVQYMDGDWDENDRSEKDYPFFKQLFLKLYQRLPPGRHEVEVWTRPIHWRALPLYFNPWMPGTVNVVEIIIALMSVFCARIGSRSEIKMIGRDVMKLVYRMLM